tara:strand:+ start:55 stop:1077 length:1023 start_codon:yes stop_codon:yes gene_type:complete
MEANQENQNSTPNSEQQIPDFEQQIMDTRAENESNDNTFEKAMGLPTEPNTQAPPARENPNRVEHPAENPVVPQQDFSKNEVKPEDNDQVRYQYWQSQASKLKNELDGYKEYAPMVDYLRSNPDAVKNLTPGSTNNTEEQVPEQEVEEFPPPPAKPEAPAGFSREAAYSDPTSESAKYLDSVEKWRDDIQTYNQLQSQYEVATLRETYNKKLEAIEKVELERKHAQEQQTQMQKVREYVSSNYNLGDDVDNFIQTMNDPNSVNMDDLVGYYQWKKSQVAPQNPQAPQPNVAPSPAFKQIQRAQSVPTPMGVQPAQSSSPSSASDSFMDALISDNKNKNIL